MPECKQCKNEYHEELSDSQDEGFCDKWCAKAWCDIHDEKIERKGGSVNIVLKEFQPYVNESFDKPVRIGSRTEERVFIKQNGAPLGDYEGMRRRQKQIRKHKEDIIHDRYKKSYGLKYPRGENKRFNEKTGEFVPNN